MGFCCKIGMIKNHFGILIGKLGKENWEKKTGKCSHIGMAFLRVGLKENRKHVGEFRHKGGNCFLIGLYIYFAKFIFLQCTQREHDYNWKKR